MSQSPVRVRAFRIRDEYPHLPRGNLPGRGYAVFGTDVGLRPYDHQRMYQTLLFLHVLSAFVLVAAIGLCWAIYVGGRRSCGSGRSSSLSGGRQHRGARVRGLARVRRLGYELWDGWILAALALWAVSGAFGSQLSQGYRAMTRGATQRPGALGPRHCNGGRASAVVDMVWKPGA